MKLVPLGDKIVLKQLEAEETTKSGIVLPGQAKEKPQEAEVIAVGPGGNIDGSNLFQICRNRCRAGWRRVHYRKTERYSRNRNRVKIVRRQMITGKNKEMFNDGKGNQIRI